MSNACPSMPGMICHTASTKPGSSGFPILSVDGKWCYGVHTLGSGLTKYKSSELNEFSSTIFLAPKSVEKLVRNQETPWDHKLLRLMGKQEYEDYRKYLAEQDSFEEFETQQEAEYYNDLYDDVEYYTVRFLKGEHEFQTTIFAEGREMMTQAQFDDSVLENRFGHYDDDNQETGKIRVLESKKKRNKAILEMEAKYAEERKETRADLLVAQAAQAEFKLQHKEMLSLISDLKAQMAALHLEKDAINAKKKEKQRVALIAQQKLQDLKAREIERQKRAKAEEAKYAEDIAAAEKAVTEPEAFELATFALHEYNSVKTAVTDTKPEQDEPIPCAGGVCPTVQDDPIPCADDAHDSVEAKTNLNRESAKPEPATETPSLFRPRAAPGSAPKPQNRKERRSKLSGNTKNSQIQSGSLKRKPPLQHWRKSENSRRTNTRNRQKSSTSPSSELKD